MVEFKEHSKLPDHWTAWIEGALVGAWTHTSARVGKKLFRGMTLDAWKQQCEVFFHG